MKPTVIFYPVIALFLLVMYVFINMFITRRAEHYRRRIHPQKIASQVQSAAVYEDNRAADHFRNLFETPVLFYTVVLALFVTQGVTNSAIWLAWLYVAARVVMMIIATGSNKVIHRMYAFFASMVALSSLWLVLMVHIWL